MKWLVFTGACAAALIGLGILAVDERDVVWNGRQAICPYCRADLADFSHACPTCRRTVDWKPSVETCTHCLAREDVDHLKNAFRALEIEDEPLPGALASYPIAYFDLMAPGKCTCCAGLKQVLGDDGEAADCPVCRGTGRCIACGGDRSVVIGDAEAWSRLLARREAWERARARSALTRLPLREDELIDEDVQSLSGFVEAEDLEPVQRLLARADDRIRGAFGALHAEHARRKREAARSEG